MLLGDMGAEVIKIAPPRRPGLGAVPGLGVSTYLPAENRSKKSVALDLKTPDGAEALAG